ncbi:MAG: hypothetical protein WC657_00170 [Candidatus Paceibacterota bacterium]|jgi:hypothetical protein
MNNWIPKNKTVKFVQAFALFVVALYFVGLFFVLSEAKKVESFYGDSKSETFKEERLLAIKVLAEANKEPIQALRDFFIQKGDEVKFIESIENVARNAGVKFAITSIDIDTSGADSFKEDVKVKMEIESTWKNTVYFLDRLKKMPFGVLIKNVSLDTSSSGGWSGFVEFVIFREK